MKNKVPAESFMTTIAANVDNNKLSDEDFREFIRNTLPIVEYIKCNKDNIRYQHHAWNRMPGEEDQNA